MRDTGDRLVRVDRSPTHGVFHSTDRGSRWGTSVSLDAIAGALQGEGAHPRLTTALSDAGRSTMVSMAAPPYGPRVTNPDRPTVPADSALARPLDRRTFLEWSGRSSLAGLALLGAFGSAAAACGSDSGGNGGTNSTGTSGTGSTVDNPLAGATLKVGVIVPQSGLGQFLGEIVGRSLDAAKQHLQKSGAFKGTTIDYVLVNAEAEKLAEATGSAYTQLVSDPDVIGILWCTPVGLREARPRIQRDQMPVIAVYADLWSAGELYPDGPERSIFQMLLPDRMAMRHLMDYAATDREYSSVGLIYDTTLLGKTKSYFENAAADAGLAVKGVEEFTLFSADYGAQLQRLRQAGPEALFVFGASDNTAGIVKGLDALDASYLDTPTAKGSQWRPQLLGWPGGTGEKKWAELSGSAAKAGTLTAWYLGGLVGGPQFAVRDWLRDAGQQPPSGGEETPANGFFALLEAARKAGTRDRRAVTESLEGLQTRFAGLEFGFDSKRHLSLTDDEVCLITLERYTGPVETDPPYVLGKEWSTTFKEISDTYVGPAHLVRPTLEANLRANPEYMRLVLEEGWGTQCSKQTPGELGSNVAMSNLCKIH